jgi:hypothetical protein
MVEGTCGVACDDLGWVRGGGPAALGKKGGGEVRSNLKKGRRKTCDDVSHQKWLCSGRPSEFYHGGDGGGAPALRTSEMATWKEECTRVELAGEKKRPHEGNDGGGG